MICSVGNVFPKLVKLFQYLVIITVSCFILITLFLALPQTEELIPEEILEERRFDLNIKDEDYWKKEFFLQFEEGTNIRERRETKNIIYQRLRRANVEEIQVKETDVEGSRGLKVIVQTIQDETFIEDLISERGYMELVVPKEDKEAEEDGLDAQMYMRENYKSTGWDREAFRNILIRQLPDEQHNQVYFAIFKEWPQDRGDFANFLREQQGKTIGLAIDGFVRPVQVDQQALEIFAVGLGPDRQNAEFHDIIFNTGVIPANYSNIESNEKTPQIYEIDHIQTTLAIIVSIIILTTYIYFKEKVSTEKIMNLGLCMLLTFSTSFSVLKIYQIPTDLFLLIIAGILTIIFIKMIYLRYKHIRTLTIFSLFTAILMVFLGTGYIIILGQYMIFVILLSIILQVVIRYYFETIKMISK